MRLALVASACLLVLGAEGGAQAQDSYAATDLKIERFAGVLEIETGGVDRIAVEYDPGEGLIDPPRFEVEGDTLVIVQLPRRLRIECRSNRDQLRLDIGRSGFRPVENYGRLVIRAPEGSDVEIFGGAMEGAIGDVGSIDLRSSSCGDVTTGEVARDAAIAVNGSGDVVAGAIGGQLNIGVNGSGDTSTGAVGGDLNIAVNGSGDTRIGAIGGGLTLAVNGSGDTRIASVGGAIHVAVNGSGDTEIASAGGEEVHAAIHGSGDISVLGGQASLLQAAIHGSGDLRFAGVVGDVDIAAFGSGDVYVDRVTGEVQSQAFGSGRVRVGQR